jgi:crotonobetainyl-CoA:carnitine CoA-transferase CaiB-like acyl-CoA transferase
MGVGYTANISAGLTRQFTLQLTLCKQTFLRLIDHADVVIEGFRPGVLQRLGLDFEMLRKRNERLIYAAITGYGQDGPYAQRPDTTLIILL